MELVNSASIPLVQAVGEKREALLCYGLISPPFLKGSGRSDTPLQTETLFMRAHLLAVFRTPARGQQTTVSLCVSVAALPSFKRV